MNVYNKPVVLLLPQNKSQMHEIRSISGIFGFGYLIIHAGLKRFILGSTDILLDF
jgi:hypothetical protein